MIMPSVTPTIMNRLFMCNCQEALDKNQMAKELEQAFNKKISIIRM